ncbi:SDR family NAD(P)-dependent oxidoreductase [Reinekea sp. G2M2-21]|uniref:SDR family NAD(P)-dependent oxidoreductase n=1 Tax=Reinekea sp. G2M2-21 TaxID=2788942 RepID=UPI0018AAC4E3|nr:SDR family NAD(P)-dependent oxidoreductase [Reinekea sp. G2M2-21]
MKNQTIVITGATRGIGQALAAQLAQHNRVIAVARDNEKLAELRQRYGVDTVVADLTDLTLVRHLATDLAQRFPELSVLINNAGVQNKWNVLQPQSMDYLHEEMNLNFHAPLALSALLLPRLMAQPESWLINVTSVLAVAPKQSTPVYNASKAALRSLTHSLRFQCRNTGVNVVEVLPPVTATGLGEQGNSEQAVSADWVAQEIIRQWQAGHTTIAVGKARWGLRLHRWLPSLFERMMIAG